MIVKHFHIFWKHLFSVCLCSPALLFVFIYGRMYGVCFVVISFLKGPLKN